MIPYMRAYVAGMLKKIPTVVVASARPPHTLANLRFAYGWLGGRLAIADGCVFKVFDVLPRPRPFKGTVGTVGAYPLYSAGCRYSLASDHRGVVPHDKPYRS
jgi:hypothetical protein